MARQIDRRSFMKGAIAAGAAGSALAWMPAKSWARVLGANQRLTFGIIGVGGMGTGHTRRLVGRSSTDNIVVTRVCDVYRRRLDRSTGIIQGGPAGDEGKGTMEYRDVIDDPAVDCVLIATPDHWHTKMAIEAMQAGKDVYCEKPLSLTIQQAIDCRDTVKRTGRVLQVGPQGTSEDRWWKAREAIAKGRIGKPTWSQGSYCRNSQGGQFNWRIDPDAGPNQPRDEPGYVWWDRWLGWEWDLAPKIPWNADHFFRFRKYFAYNGGVATDLLYHRLAPLLLAISGHDGEYPKRVVASGGKYLEKDERDIPDTFMMMVDYPSEHTVVLISVMTNDVGLPYVIRGQHGTMTFNGGIDVQEQRAWAEEFRRTNRDLVGDASDVGAGEVSFHMQTGSRRDHVGNFMDAIREDAPLACNVDLGTSVMVAIKMGVEAYRQNKVMLWDASREVAYPS